MIRDTVDPVNDERLASFVVASHARSHPDARPEEGPEAAAGDADVLSQGMLRKYVTYAKQTCRPRLQLADHDKIAQVRRGFRRGVWAGCEEAVRGWGRIQRNGGWPPHPMPCC